jgi:multiple sugar transport system permease protein
VVLLPVVWMVGTSVKPAGEYVSTSIALFPTAPTLGHYRALADGDLLGKLVNSVIVALGATALALAAGFPAAYALARLSLPRRLDIVFLVFVLVVKLAPPSFSPCRSTMCCAPSASSTRSPG